MMPLILTETRHTTERLLRKDLCLNKVGAGVAFGMSHGERKVSGRGGTGLEVVNMGFLVTENGGETVCIDEKNVGC